jgi:predicted nucleotidyltransferase component of viral defense system
VKDHLIQSLQNVPPSQKKNVAREFVQVYLLRLVHETGAQARMVFVGGTALRLLHRLPRYSEDLDFSLVPGETLDTDEMFQRLENMLQRAGYVIGLKKKAKRNVTSAFFRFRELPHDCGFSRDPRVSLAVKIEIDMQPPEGGKIETTLIQRFYPIALRHHDLPSLFAGKLHALLTRPYVKGRDWFDLIWYLTEQRGLEPNLVLLQNALKQTGHETIHPSQWRSEVNQRLDDLDWGQVASDLEIFVERRGDLEQIRPELIASLLRMTNIAESQVPSA